ncbi:hypothetical protein BCCH1_24400 [Burkholderia contaminans]|uniref:Uncharacterized protein n=1 Tax=Burkholderia contaminans TaxID=488447 RepID=A0A250L605_9BURK|nr:hypothetical protein BCCH1_24400 [Burkholderia contaminans]GLZ69220.1 hypothetical protein Bcon01_22650 [Burkholderia contaminans]
MWRDSAGWESRKSVAALLILPSSATRKKYSIRRESTGASVHSGWVYCTSRASITPLFGIWITAIKHPHYRDNDALGSIEVIAYEVVDRNGPRAAPYREHFMSRCPGGKAATTGGFVRQEGAK